MKKNTLLIGNSINLLDSNISWKNLLDQIVRNMNKNGIVSFDAKPYPLLYEEIFTRGIKYVNYTEDKIRDAIDQASKTIRINDYHSKLMALPFENILTTNYDYCLELSVVDTLPENTNHERKYSLFRKYRLLKKNVWHIHGELNQKTSLMLGYEHYSGALQKMRNYMTSTISIKSKQVKSPFKQNIFNFENEEYYSWIDIFLRDNIYIVGLGLDFDEIDLWWLISYRNRQIIEKKMICGKIYYYYFLKDPIISENEKAKLEMLEILNISPMPISLEKISGEWDYKAGWDLILTKLKDSL